MLVFFLAYLFIVAINWHDERAYLHYDFWTTQYAISFHRVNEWLLWLTALQCRLRASNPGSFCLRRYIELVLLRRLSDDMLRNAMNLLLSLRPWRIAFFHDFPAYYCVTTTQRNVSAVKRYKTATDRLSDFKLGVGVVIKTDRDWREILTIVGAKPRNKRFKLAAAIADCNMGLT